VKAGLALSALSGFVALSYEILWFRVASFASAGSARAFPLLLGFYLLGLAGGSLGARRWCRDAPLGPLAGFTALANALGFLVIPAYAALAARGTSWIAALPLVAAASAGLGAVFPLVSHASIPPDGRAGSRLSYLYLANIAGCAAGSLLTGFVLMDRVPLSAISISLGVAGQVLAGVVLLLARPVRALRLAGLAAGAAAIVVAGPGLLDALYERLQFKAEYRPGLRFARVVETKSGVITVTPDGRIFGGGVYDGAYNTALGNDVNLIVRAYALAELHPAPREVLMIGLSSGSWARVVADHPGVERLTIVEINPGYVRLLPEHPEVAGLLSDPKVRIEFDDARRWLVRAKDRRFDAIVANTTFHWRSNATNLLSAEFLDLVRARLRPGGVYYLNTTGSDRVVATGLARFPHALRIYACLALSDAPIRFDVRRWKERMRSYPGGDAAGLDGIAEALGANLERDGALRARLGGVRLISDDNMGSEWTDGP
jgi:hypothetical protein